MANHYERFVGISNEQTNFINNKRLLNDYAKRGEKDTSRIVKAIAENNRNSALEHWKNNQEAIASQQRSAEMVAGSVERASERHSEEMQSMSRDISLGLQQLNDNFNWKLSSLIERVDYSNKVLDNILIEVKRADFEKEIDAYTRSGDEFYNIDLEEEALEVYLKALERNKVNFPVQFKAGIILLMKKEFEVSAEHFRLSGKYARSYNSSNHSALGYLYAAISYYFTNNIKKAIDCALIAKHINSNLSQAYYDLGKYYAHDNQKEKGLMNLEIAILMNPSHAIDVITDIGFDVIRQDVVQLLEQLHKNVRAELDKRMKYMGDLGNPGLVVSFWELYEKIIALDKENTYLGLLKAIKYTDELVDNLRNLYINKTEEKFVQKEELYKQTISLCKQIKFIYTPLASVEQVIKQILSNFQTVDEFRNYYIDSVDPLPGEKIIFKTKLIQVVKDEHRYFPQIITNLRVFGTINWYYHEICPVRDITEFNIFINTDYNIVDRVFFFCNGREIKFSFESKEISTILEWLKPLIKEQPHIKINEHRLSKKEKRKDSAKIILKNEMSNIIGNSFGISLIPSVILGVWLKESYSWLVLLIIWALCGLLVFMFNVSETKNLMTVDGSVDTKKLNDAALEGSMITAIIVFIFTLILGTVTQLLDILSLSNEWGKNYFYYFIIGLVIGIVKVFKEANRKLF